MAQAYLPWTRVLFGSVMEVLMEAPVRHHLVTAVQWSWHQRVRGKVYNFTVKLYNSL